MRIYLRIEQDHIQEASFEANGCGPVVAIASLGTELLSGLTLGEAHELDAFRLDKELGGLPPSKRHAILMFLDCLDQALALYEERKNRG